MNYLIPYKSMVSTKHGEYLVIGRMGSHIPNCLWIRGARTLKKGEEIEIEGLRFFVSQDYREDEDGYCLHTL